MIKRVLSVRRAASVIVHSSVGGTNNKIEGGRGGWAINSGCGYTYMAMANDDNQIKM